jgi:hypothetical protein
MSWSDPIADLLDAAIANLTGDDARARRLLATAVQAFDRHGMSLYAAAARRRLAALAVDDEAAECHRRSLEWMDREGVVDPDRMTRLIAPGFADAISPRRRERSTG